MTPPLLLAVDLLAHGGIQRVSRSLLTGLAQQGPVDVWSLQDRTALQDVPLHVTVRAFGGSKPRFVSAGLRAAFAPPPVVVASHVQLAPVALPLKWRGSRLIIYVHGVEVWRPPTGAQRAAIRSASRVVANSSFTLRRMEEFYGKLPADRSRVLPPGLPDRPRPSRPGQPHVVLVVGRMTAEDRYKGHDELLGIWPKLRGEVRDARLVFVGDGDDRSRLEGKARDLGIAESVEFTGAVTEGEVASWYERAGVVALPSRLEGFGLVLLEAMRAARPVLAAPGAAAEIVEAGSTGLIADPASPAALESALRTLLTDTERSRAMGDAGRRRFEEKFTDARFHAGLRDILSDLRIRHDSAIVKEPVA